MYPEKVDIETHVFGNFPNKVAFIRKILIVNEQKLGIFVINVCYHDASGLMISDGKVNS